MSDTGEENVTTFKTVMGQLTAYRTALSMALDCLSAEQLAHLQARLSIVLHLPTSG